MKLKVCLHPEPDGGYWVEVPGFPGCVSEGDTLEEALTNIREAFEGVFEVLQDRSPASDQPGQLEEIEL